MRERTIAEDVVRRCQAAFGTAGARAVARELGLGKSTVCRIWRRLRAMTQVEIVLEDGETRLERGVYCADGHYCQVWPCRECRIQAQAKERKLTRLNVICPKCKAGRKRRREAAREDEAQRVGKTWRCVRCQCEIRHATPAELAAIARRALSAAEARFPANGAAKTAGPTTNGAGMGAASG